MADEFADAVIHFKGLGLSFQAIVAIHLLCVFAADRFLSAHSCLRFYRNRKAVETTDLVET